MEKKDVKKISECLQEKASLDVCLERAINENNMEMATTLIDMGADPNCSFASCVQKGKLQATKLLIEKGANTCQRDKSKIPVLSLAISTGNLKIIKLLLKNGAQFTIHSGLMRAIDKHNLEVVRLLIKRGATVNFLGENGMTPLFLCLTKAEPNFEIMNELIGNGADLNMVTPQGLPLLAAIESGNLEVVKQLIQKGADVNKCDKNKNYPIISAAKKSYKFVELLCKSGAEVNATNSDGENALFECVRRHNFAMVEYLVEREVDLNQKSKRFNNTVLEIALREFNFRTFDFLLKAGANPDLASRAIEEMIRDEPDFDIYMKRQKNKK
ncbi:hypothetical protein Zmor_021152 [Zophobas morio]|uniref:Ankyrin repeat protein n=2 Tax=Zophobas morio TaxID=2755281 RepID=A0AA38I6Z0_9CUCU|nr:hypothetical protein Zmor_021152 [Zophobas morio]